MKKITSQALKTLVALLLAVLMVASTTVTSFAVAKDDLAETGWTKANCYIHGNFGSGWNDYYMNDNGDVFVTATSTSQTFKLVAESTWYGNKGWGGNGVTAGSQCTAHQENNDSGSDLTASLAKGTYKFHYDSRSSDNKALFYTPSSVTVYPAGSKFYLNLSDFTNWKSDSARFAAYFCNSGTAGQDGAWVSATACPGNDNWYYVTCPANSTYTTLIWCRMDGSNNTNNWDNKYNQTADLSYESGKYTTKITDWGSGTQNNTTHTHTITITGKGRDYSGATISNLTSANSSGTPDWTTTSTYNPADYKVATAPSGYTYTGMYTNAACSTTAGTSISNTGDATYYALYTHNKVNVNFKNTSGTGGTVSQGGTQKISSLTTSNQAISTDYNRSYDYTITPASGYKITAVSGGGWTIADDGQTATKTFSATATTTITVTQALKTYAITLSETGASGGTMQVDSAAFTSGSTVTHDSHSFRVDAPSGYLINSISGIGTWTISGDESYATLGSTSITSAQTISVTYKAAGTCAFDLSKASTTLNIGGTDTFTATPNSHHSSGTISASSSDESVATVSKSGNTYTVTAVAPGTATITVSCTDTGNTASTFSVTVSEPSVSAFSYSTANCNIGSSSVSPSVTTTNPSNSSSLPSDWSIVYSITAGSDYATINSSTGVITGRKSGSVTVKASLQYNSSEKASKTTTFTVNTPTVSFSNTSAVTLYIGQTETRNATGSAIGSTNVTADNITYSSSAPGIASVSSSGVITGVAAGSATITATRSITCDGKTTEVTTSTNVSVTVNAPNITAFSYSTANCNIGATSVSPTITTTNPSNSSALPSGWSIVYSITTGSSYATINSSTGVITGKAASGSGGVTVTASLQYNNVEKKTRTTTFTVNAASVSAFSYSSAVSIGNTSSTPSVTASNCNSLTKSFAITDGSEYATINSSTGAVTGRKAGTVTVTVYYKLGETTITSRDTTITVSTPTVSFSSTTSSTINIGATTTRTVNKSAIGTVTSDTITCSSSDSAIATASYNSSTNKVTVTGVKPGNVTISATRTIVCDGKNTTVNTTTDVSVTVRTPSISQGNVTIAKGDSYTLSTATTNPSSGITVTFALSGTPDGVSCTPAGVVTVAKNSSAASATVVATAKNSGGTTVKTKNITVTIEAPSITVNDGTDDIAANATVYKTVGQTLALASSSTNINDPSYIVTSSNTSVATVSGTTITMAAPGTTTITVTAYNGTAPVGASMLMAYGITAPRVKPLLASVGAGDGVSATSTFTLNVAAADTNHYVYFSNGGNWSSPVIHAWGSSGTVADRAAMTKIGVNNLSQDVYAYKFTAVEWAQVQNIHFLSSSGATWSDSSNSDNTHTFTGSELSHNGFYNDGTYDLTLVKPQIEASDITIDMGSTNTMTATVLTSGTPSTFNWSSGDTTVATTADTHTASNVITGVDAGTATITIKAYAEKPSGWVSIVTDGTADDFVAGSTTATATVTADNKNITYRGKYTDDNSTWNDLTASQGTFTVTAGGSSIGAAGTAHSIAYNTVLTLTATPTADSGYVAEGIYWSIDNGAHWTKIECTKSGDTLTNNTFEVRNNFLIEARFVKTLKLSAFDSYTSDSSTVTFVTAPPKTITIKHTDYDSVNPTSTTYTYTYDGTKAKGNPNSPDAGETPPAALPIESGTYGQGNYIQFYPGDEITLIYSAMASSEIIKGVFYNNNANFYVNKPEVGQFVAHDYAVAHTLYMNSAYYDSVPAGLPSTTADPDAHSIKFTGTQDYKNIDVEIGSKRKIYFNDYDNTVIQSKNTDDYYYDGEDLSVTGDQLIVKAAKSATQTNSIDATQVRYYKATAEGGKGTELTAEEKTDLELSISGSTSTSSSSDDGAALIFNGKMPAYDLYIDLNMANTYTLKLGSKVIADPFESKTRLAQVATVKIKQDSTDKLTAPSGSDVTSTSADIATGTTIALDSTFTDSWGTWYMFVGWYWGTDSAPDYEKGFISDKASLNYTPKKGGTIWAVGTRSLYINGSKYITGKDTDWYSESDSQKNLRMEFDAESGKYYWEITDTMFAAAGYNYKTWETSWEGWNEETTAYGIYKLSEGNYYWTNDNDSYHGKGYFQIFNEENTNSAKTLWDNITSFKVDTPANGPTYGKIYPRGAESDYDRKHNGQGFINFNETDYNGFSSPLRIYYDPSATGNARLTVEATPIYCDLYVSNGFDVGSTSRTSAVTVQPVVDGVVKTSGQAGYFDVNKRGEGWDPNVEGHVNHYKPKKKAATVRITKTAGGSDKISAFFIYDVVNKTVRAEKNVQVSGSNYYIDLTLPSDAHKYYIVPIVEEAGANVTITFDAAQLNRSQWGDIVSAYAWYSGSGGDAMGGYPGQPMIPSDDMSTWTATFKGTNGSSDKIAGITFTNYVDNIHSWLGCSGVMGTVTYGGSGTAGSPTTVSIADGAIIKQYNMIESGTNKEYSRANFKAQTYDYREPIALYDRSVGSDHVSISFSMKDGNSSLVSWHHSELLSNNILSLPSGWTDLNWEYLKNAKGDKYVDMNGNTIKTKPTASFYVAAKGQVMYNNSSMTNVFYGGKGYDAVSDVTYGGANGVNMNYAVQWYIYDASGNYITNVLSAGIADLSSNGVDSYIGKALEDLGYAVDGKSVSVCYDKPRYMYGDDDAKEGAVGYNSKHINNGDNFDAYRFTGQWNVVASNDLVSVKVGVGMMTDSGEVLAGSNTAAYGNASAMYDTTKGNNIPVTDSDGNTAPFTASDSSFIRTSVRDAEKSPVKLNASSQNFIGWYYYDANTGDFVKANYASNENYYPNYSNKDVTFYAMYHASAVYQFNYTGREGTRTYSASGDDLTEAEMGASNVINPASHADDIKSKVPTGITRFKKDIDFKSTSYDSWTKTPEETGYILNISGFRVSTPTFTLTAHYKDANGDLRTLPVEAAYDTTTVDLTTLNGGTAVTSLYGQRFLGWYERKSDGTAGDLISTQANYGLRLTGNQNIIAVYDETGSSTRPEDLEGWHVSIDDNLVTKELTTDTSGVFYNDTIVRVRNGSDVKAELPGEATIGVLVVVKDDGATKEPNTYNTTQLGKLVAQISSGNTAKTKNGLIITNMQTPVHTQFNRTDIAVRSDFAKTNGKSYCVYAYMYDGSAYHFSDPSAVKTYE